MKLQAVILDWAGTVVDHGSLAPVATLLEVFGEAGVPVTVSEARLSMGIAKKTHIASILEIPRVADEWTRVKGIPPDSGCVDRLYASFIPRQLSCLRKYSSVIAGVPAAVERIRARGLKIGTTTGYTRTMLDSLLATAREQGFSPDAAFCPDDVPSGRPAPWMCYRNAIEMSVYPMSTMVKIGDTPSDIAEGLNAGMWTIGITRTGNETGLSETEWNELSSEKKLKTIQNSARRLMAAGAHYLAESVAVCDEILFEIERRVTPVQVKSSVIGF